MSDWKQNLQKTRYVMDVLLIFSFMIVSAPQATGNAIHEWLSLVFIVPFFIHLLLHWDWIKQSGKKLFAKQSGKARFNQLWNYLIYIMMLFVFVSGLLVSASILPVFDIDLTIQNFWSKLHHDTANMIMPMIGVHLALHFQWIIKSTEKMRAKRA